MWEGFFKLNKKKLAIFFIILVFLPMPILPSLLSRPFSLTCGFEPALIVILFGLLDPSFSLVAALVLSIPGIILSYLLAHYIYKLLVYLYKDRGVSWISVLIILAVSIVLFISTKNLQMISFPDEFFQSDDNTF